MLCASNRQLQLSEKEPRGGKSPRPPKETLIAKLFELFLEFQLFEGKSIAILQKVQLKTAVTSKRNRSA